MIFRTAAPLQPASGPGEHVQRDRQRTSFRRMRTLPCATWPFADAASQHQRKSVHEDGRDALAIDIARDGAQLVVERVLLIP